MAENILTREVAGQPVGVWAVVVAGGLGIAYFVNKQQSSDIEPQAEPITEPGVGTGLVPAGAAIVPGSSDTGQEGFENNSQWGNAARAFLIARGHNPSIADNAIRKYLVAEQLTQQEDAMVQEVLRSDVGVPPEDIQPAPTPGPTQPEGEPRHRWTHSPWPGYVAVNLNSRLRLSGRFSFSGNPPGSPQTVNVQMLRKKGDSWETLREFQLQTNSNGEWSTSLIATRRGTNRVLVSWAGQDLAPDRETYVVR